MKKMRIQKYGILLLLLGVMGVANGCQDLLMGDSNSVIYAEKEHLNSTADTLYSVVGILNKLQALSDRLVLMGELKADLVTVNDVADADLREIASFSVSNENKYNCPADFYAVIANCNYYLAHVDTTLKEHNKPVFQREIAAVKTIRAWTYLQLALTYGKVPFVLTPITSEKEAQKSYPEYELQDICAYFINDLEGWTSLSYPGLGTVAGIPGSLLFLPAPLVKAELELWSAQTQEDYRRAATDYLNYILSKRLTIGNYSARWPATDPKFEGQPSASGYRSLFTSEQAGGEVLSLIPTDTCASAGYYSQLRNLYNSTPQNEGRYSIVPSLRIEELSAAQIYCNKKTDSNIPAYAPTALSDHRSGDLRLYAVWDLTTLQDKERQTIRKLATGNVWVYRTGEVYLHLAEAMNRAGYSRFAFMLLKYGLTDNNLKRYVLPYCSSADSTYFAQFTFNVNAFSEANSVGIHSRGCGDVEVNEHYLFPVPADSLPTLADTLSFQLTAVEELLVDEMALETCFEGKRFYDLMRIALHRNDPSYLTARVHQRYGEEQTQEAMAEIQANLTDSRNWYISKRGEVGYKK